jgi:putative acetyltransferase
VPAPELTIRPERPDDVPAIAAVVEAAFGSPAEARLVEAIRASDGFRSELSLVAVDGEDVVGHVMISAASLHDGDRVRPIVTLSPLAVAPDRQRQGIGSLLVREVTARAEAGGEPLVVLEGDPAYYGRLGFEPSVPLGIEIRLPDWAPPEAAQVMRFASFDPATRGQVVYSSAFDEVVDH